MQRPRGSGIIPGVKHLILNSREANVHNVVEVLLVSARSCPKSKRCELLGCLAPLVRIVLPEMGTTHLVQTYWSLGRLTEVGTEAATRDDLTSKVSNRLVPGLKTCTPAEVVMTAIAVAELRYNFYVTNRAETELASESLSEVAAALIAAPLPGAPDILVTALTERAHAIMDGSGSSTAGTIRSESALQAKAATAEVLPEEVFSEEKVVAFGAESSQAQAQSTDQGVINLLLKMTPSDKWAGTGREANGIDSPWTSLHTIRTIAQEMGWLKSKYPVTGVTPPPLSANQLSQLTDEQRAVYFIVFEEVGNKWNRPIMDKHRANVQQFREKSLHCRENGLTVEKSMPSARGAVRHWGSDAPETNDPTPESGPTPGPLEEVMAHVAEIQYPNDAHTAEVAEMKELSASQPPKRPGKGGGGKVFGGEGSRQFNPTDLVKIAHALMGRALLLDLDLLDVVATPVMAAAAVGTLGPRDIADFTWAVTRLIQAHPRAPRSLLDRLYEMLRGLCAAAILPQRDGEVVLMDRFNSRDLAQFIHSLARVGYDDVALFSLLQHRIRAFCTAATTTTPLPSPSSPRPLVGGPLATASNRELVMVVYSLARLNFDCKPLMLVLEHRTQPTSQPEKQQQQQQQQQKTGLSDWPSQELANAAWSLATQALVDSPLVPRIFAEAARRPRDPLNKGAGGVTSAPKAPKEADTRQKGRSSSSLSSETKGRSHPPLPPLLVVHRIQLYQLWQLLSVLNTTTYQTLAASLDPLLIEDMEVCWRREKRATKDSSKVHTMMSQYLTEMEVVHVIEDPIYDIDIAVYETRLAVEVDGPHHFSVVTHRALGRTALKHRLLSLAGWNVVHIPSREFTKIPVFATMERKRYLQRKLGLNVTLKFSDVDSSACPDREVQPHERKPIPEEWKEQVIVSVKEDPRTWEKIMQRQRDSWNLTAWKKEPVSKNGLPGTT